MLVVLGLVITLFFAVLALFADQLAPYERGPVPQGGRGRGRRHADLRDAPQAGRAATATTRSAPRQASLDVFSRVIHGARLAFGVVILSTVLSMVDRRAARA